ncbi:MAG: hypothetical protein K8S27_15810 [Candidatus Omnitrophica bacterium]|nr:hypothetical protein [Candidatus Omnitrophota bacterium]
MRQFFMKFFFCLCVLIILPQQAQSAVPVYNTFDYYPTQQGSNWSYHLTGTDSTGAPVDKYALSSIAGFDSEDYGGTVYSGFKMVGDYDFTVMSADYTGLSVIKHVDLFGGDYVLFGSESSVLPDAPYTVVPASWSHGDTYSLRYKEYYFDQYGNSTGEADLFMEQELNAFVGSMTVVAGTFSDVVHLHSTLTEGAWTEVVDLYLAKDVGVIKELRGTVTSELIGYSIAPEPISSFLFLSGCLPFGFGIWRKRRH